MLQARTITARSRRRPLLWAAAALVGLVLLLWLLLVSGEPAVPPTARPTAQTVQAGRDALQQIRGSGGSASASTRVEFDNRHLQGLAALASDASGYERVEARVADGTFVAAASLPLPLGQWLNGSVSVTGQKEGFPVLRFKAGSLTLPGWAGRPIAELGRWLLGWRGVELPPLDEVVRKVAVGPELLVAELSLPRRSGLVRGLIGIQGQVVDSSAVAQSYCRLVSLQRRAPSDDLVIQVRRAFAEPGADAVAANRADFVALAIATVGRRAEHLAPGVSPRIRACGGMNETIRLAGRSDLAKHWTLSAALGAVLGTGAAAAMGEWKELSDSLPNGSGFSFLDLAADRSGLHAAREGTDPATATATAARLRLASEEGLLPIALMAAQEGLTEEQFLSRYRGIDAREYQRIVSWIDRELARVR